MQLMCHVVTAVCLLCRALWSQLNTQQLLTVEEGALRSWTIADAAVQVGRVLLLANAFER